MYLLKKNIFAYKRLLLILHTLFQVDIELI